MIKLMSHNNMLYLISLNIIKPKRDIRYKYRFLKPLFVYFQKDTLEVFSYKTSYYMAIDMYCVWDM